ncbi:MAG: Eco57I restriction-modification methylase domain-containing protein, partial [Brevinema sp.]
MYRQQKEDAKQKITSLVEAFKSHEHEYLKITYNETQVRREFIDPLFEILGWDVGNEANKKQKVKDVILEYRQSIVANDGSFSNKRPDYAFQFNGKLKFFVEAKAPHVNLANSESAIFQVRNYGYHKRLAISVLTDFQELYIYDTKISLKKTIKPLKSFKYEEFIDRFDELWDCLSYEAMDNEYSQFSRWQDQLSKDTEKYTINSDFLGYLNEFREELAKNIAKKNLLNGKIAYSEYDLNYIVQKIIDRVIFLRIAEARGLEYSETLKTLSNSSDIYTQLNDYFIKCQKRYNSDLFPSKDPKMSEDNALFSHLKIDDSIFKTYIKKRLYDENYWLFEEIPVEILGSIYEHFLGKTIYITDKRVRIEDKPEVKKAKGVYYTPQYIVNYIVAQTVGKQLEGQDYKNVDLSVLDSACGSGAFLLGAYEYLLTWYRDQYTANKARIDSAKKDKKIYEKKNSNDETDYFLHISERKRILTEHIYGVDIDHQAVEMAKLSLILKMMEDASPDNDLYHITEKETLPDLSEYNIKCGNSLVDEYGLFDDESVINILDWKRAFSRVFAKGGFTTIIGNPPYVKEYTSTDPFIFKNCSSTGKYYEGKMDLWYAFTCLALDTLLRPNGYHSYIATSNWNTAGGASILRKNIFQNSTLLEYTDFADYRVFATASIQTMIFITKKETSKTKYHFNYKLFTNKNITPEKAEELLLSDTDINMKAYPVFVDSSKIVKGELLTFENEVLSTILDKINQKANYFLNDKEVAQGIVPNPDIVNVTNYRLLKSNIIKEHNINVGDGVFIVDKNLLKLPDDESIYLKPLYEPVNVDRFYMPNDFSKHILYLTKKNCNKNNIPNILKHLQKFKPIMSERRETKSGQLDYFHLHWPRDNSFFTSGAKILAVRKCPSFPIFTYTEKEAYVMMAFNVIKTERINMKYLNGILNSKLIHFWLKNRGKLQGSQLQIDKAPLLQIPLVNEPKEY